MFSHLSCLIDGEGDTAGREDDNGGRVVVVLVAEPEEDGEDLEDVERVQHLLDQQVGNGVERNQDVVRSVHQTPEMNILKTEESFF